MAGRRISGIFVPIQLDTSNVQRDLEKFNGELGTVINTIQKRFEGALNTKDLANSIVRVTRAMGELRDSSAALGKIDNINIFQSKIEGLNPALKKLSTAFGGTVKQQKELFTQLVKTQAIDQQVKALQTLQRATRLSTEETLKLVRARGMAVSTEAVTQFSKPNTPTAGGRGWTGIFTPTSMAAGAQSALAAGGVVTGMYGAVELTKSAYQASLKMENLQLAFESVFGSASKATAQLDFVRQVSDKLGLSFLATAEGAKKMFAAARGTEVENDANQIFQAFSTMSAALKLTGDETNSVFLAISQMMSKGKISAEELRLQLSERMPGAVTLFAKAIGVTTKELDVMLQKGQVGLDSLRKFAVEVQNTYAAGAAGASKGLQAELNRVGNAWFDLKRAFVDARGSAETLSVLTDTLKGLTAMAPAIAKLAGVFLKFAVATTASYGAVKALTAIKTALLGVESASVLLGGSMKRLSETLVAFAKTPLGIALTIGALGVTVWSLISAQSDGMKSIEQYSTSLDDMAKSASNASGKMDELNKSVKDRSIELQSEAVLSAQKLFEGALSPQTQYLLDQSIPVILKVESPFSRTLEKMKRGGADWNQHISAAQELGKTFSAEFNKAMESGADEETTKAIIDQYVIEFALIKEKLTQAGQTEVAKTFESAVSSVLNLAKDWSGKTNVFKSMSEDAKDTTQHLLTFNKEFEAIQKITQGTELGKELKYKEEAEASVKSLLAMGKAVQTAHARMAELGSKTAENAEEWKKNEDIVKKNEQAFVLLGQAAVKNKMDLSILNEAIRVAGEVAKMTTEEIEALQKKMAEGFRLGGIKTGENLLKDLDTEIALSKATAGQKKAFSVLSPYIKDDASKFNIVTMLMKDDVKGLQDAFKDTSFVAENMTGILAKAGELAGSADTKKGTSNWESINSTIQSTTKTLETWKAKLAESQADQFGTAVVAELEKIDKTLRSSKATSEQIAQLKELRKQIEEVGEARKKQVADEERLKIREELTRTGSRVTRAFKGLVGIDNSEVYNAAKQQYDLDVEFFQKALAKKQISQEEFNNYMMMLDQTLVDAQLRSQTDMFSRLQAAANDYYIKYGDFTKHVGSVVTNAMDDSARAIAAFARSGASDFKSLADAFASMADRMLTTATELFAQQAVSALWSGAMKLFSSPKVDMSAPGMAQGSMSSNGQIVRHANGGAYFGGNLSSYSGSIVSSPTLFSTGTKVPAYASGAGLMGEAGPEGIFPLTRDSSGKLGVRAKSGIGAALNQNINVNVINNTSSQVTTQETKDNQGNVSIDVMIEEHVGKAMRRPGSAPFKAIQNNWGGSPALAQRG